MTEDRNEIFNLEDMKTISVYTGNVVRWCGSMKKCPTSTAQEVLDCLKAALCEWGSKYNSDQMEGKIPEGLPEHLVCDLIQPTERIDPDEREDIRISAKLFICQPDIRIVKEAVTCACSELGVSQLDSVILSVVALSEENRPTREDLMPYWKELEVLVQGQKVASIGVSDLDREVLEALCQHAQVQPSSNQVNLVSCCVIPPDLAAFAKDNNIQLLTHNDPADILPVGSFQQALRTSLQDPRANEWVPHWILRYSAVIKERGIIKSKGYMVHAEKQAARPQ
ncbi:glutamate--cysteine ligase regulatory subunit-like isoform X1 [Hemiscyllium ocellatum]|uniref:glutamate--cysteine ligase regulatory subunit-like isoform X1 n=1 Tax=Hemiscyllium ocellatum TaxID=170820 RepID=UPI002965D4F4|nr:glutamate--cysteine ligase regulatory subunit-like isoform X1 [Hemiscyllium ocellatum]